MKNKLLFLIAFVAAFLAGCAAPGVQSNVAPDLGQKGLLLLPVTDRALFTATGASFWIVDSKGNRELLVVNDWAEEIPRSDGKGKRFFGVFTLPPGDYKFARWHLNRTKGGASDEPKEPFTFRLNAGEAVYVGNFNAVRPLGTGQFRDRFNEDVRHYRSLYPWMSGLTVRQEQMGPAWWSLPGGSEPK